MFGWGWGIEVGLITSATVAQGLLKHIEPDSEGNAVFDVASIAGNWNGMLQRKIV